MDCGPNAENRSVQNGLQNVLHEFTSLCEYDEEVVTIAEDVEEIIVVEDSYADDYNTHNDSSHQQTYTTFKYDEVPEIHEGSNYVSKDEKHIYVSHIALSNGIKSENSEEYATCNNAQNNDGSAHGIKHEPEYNTDDDGYFPNGKEYTTEEIKHMIKHEVCTDEHNYFNRQMESEASDFLTEYEYACCIETDPVEDDEDDEYIPDGDVFDDDNDEDEDYIPEEDDHFSDNESYKKSNVEHITIEVEQVKNDCKSVVPHSFHKKRRNSSGGDHKCPVCHSCFARVDTLRTHMKVHAKVKTFKCVECNALFGYKHTLQEHVRVRHSGNISKFCCTLCTATFKYKSSLNAHLVAHSGEKPFHCHLCSSKFSNNSHLTRHMRTHTGEKPFNCSKCDAKFRNKESLKYHFKKNHKTKDDEVFKCDKCSATFITKFNLNKHSVIHTDEKRFACKECDAEFHNKGNLEKHFRTHTTGRRTRTFPCHDCDFTFSRKKQFDAHCKTKHSGNKKHFACDICDGKYRNKNYLNIHKKKHEGIAVFECTDCGVAFIRKRLWDKHKCKTDSNEKIQLVIMADEKEETNDIPVPHNMENILV